MKQNTKLYYIILYYNFTIDMSIKCCLILLILQLEFLLFL